MIFGLLFVNCFLGIIYKVDTIDNRFFMVHGAKKKLPPKSRSQHSHSTSFIKVPESIWHSLALVLALTGCILRQDPCQAYVNGHPTCHMPLATQFVLAAVAHVEKCPGIQGRLVAYIVTFL